MDSYNYGIDREPKKKFHLSHARVMQLVEAAGIRGCWDFNSAYGDTIKEKYESLYIKLVEVTNVLISKKIGGYFWAVTSPEITSIFQTATAGFAPTIGGYDAHMPFGITDDIKCCGVINAKWKLWEDSEMPSNQILIGANPYTRTSQGPTYMDLIEEIIPSDTAPEKCAVISMANFII